VDTGVGAATLAPESPGGGQDGNSRPNTPKLSGFVKYYCFLNINIFKGCPALHGRDPMRGWLRFGGIDPGQPRKAGQARALLRNPVGLQGIRRLTRADRCGERSLPSNGVRGFLGWRRFRCLPGRAPASPFARQGPPSGRIRSVEGGWGGDGEAAGPAIGLSAAGSRARTAAESGPWCERTYMKSTSESLSHPETSCGKAADGNCVVVRRGGVPPEADLRSQTKVNPIRFNNSGELSTSIRWTG
jgi:hypothetical protein